MLKFAFDAITSFSLKPLKIATWLGVLAMLGGLGYLVYAVVAWFFGKTETGWASIILVNILFFGAILIILGIQGAYIGRIYEEIKARPLYVVRDVVERK
jgi:dolichol-phosphate mannosyltransferase